MQSRALTHLLRSDLTSFLPAESIITDRDVNAIIARAFTTGSMLSRQVQAFYRACPFGGRSFQASTETQIVGWLL